MPSHYLNQYWNIVSWTLRNKLKWNFNWNSNIFIHENALQNGVCEMASILSRPQCVNTDCLVLFSVWFTGTFKTASNWSFEFYFYRWPHVPCHIWKKTTDCCRCCPTWVNVMLDKITPRRSPLMDRSPRICWMGYVYLIKNLFWFVNWCIIWNLFHGKLYGLFPWPCHCMIFRRLLARLW